MNYPTAVDRWVSYKEAEELPQSPLGGMGGWFGSQKAQRWPDYLEVWKPEWHPILEALRADILAKGLRKGGWWHQSELETGCPVFNDGTALCCSMRGWGDLMAAIWSSEDDQDYHYVDFYCENDVPKRVIEKFAERQLRVARATATFMRGMKK